MESAEEVYLNALERSDPKERANYLNQACGHDPGLRQLVENLIRDAGEADAYFISATSSIISPNPGSHYESPGARIGRYRLLAKIGEGGMGVVYRTEQYEPVHRQVALKVIKPGMDTRSVVARFEAERQALALMDHPNIAKVLDGGTTEAGRPYFVMELVEGVPITEFCAKHRLPIVNRLRLFIHVCQAVQHAHQKGIVHRDLKPSNVMVTVQDGEPVPKVIDFGVAKAVDQKLTHGTLLTRHATLIGTPTYMSPEQADASGLDVDTRSDIYSLGVLLYELLTGTQPFPEQRLRRASASELQCILLQEEPERPSMRLRKHGFPLAPKTGDPAPESLPSDLDWIVMKCLEKDRDRRYETANGLAADLRRHLANDLVVARPPSAAYRLQKMARRNRLAVAAGSAVALALCFGLAASWWLFLRERKAHDRAVNAERATADQLRRANQAIAGARIASAMPGQRWASLAAISNAAAVQPSLELRNEAIQALALTDISVPVLGPDRPENRNSAELFPTVFDHELQRVAMIEQDGTLRVLAVADGKTLLKIALGPSGSPIQGGALLFSPDDHRLAFRSVTGRVRCWNLDTGRLLIDETVQADDWNSLGFTPDSGGLLVGESTGDLRQFAVSSLAPFREVPVPSHKEKTTSPADVRSIFPFRPGVVPHRFAFDIKGSQMAVTDGKAIEIWNWPERRLLTRFEDPSISTPPGWHPDGRHLWMGTKGGQVHLWEVFLRGHRVLSGHRELVHHFALHPRGDLLATASWDGRSMVWDMSVDTPLFSTDSGMAAQFSRDGTSLGLLHASRRYAVCSVLVSRVFRSLAGASGNRRMGTMDFSSDERWLLWADNLGLWWVNLEDGRYATRYVPGLTHARLDAEETGLILAGANGLARWPIVIDPTAREPDLKLLGEPEPLGSFRFPLEGGQEIPPDRRWVIEFERYNPAGGSRILIRDPGGSERLVVDPDPAGIINVSLSRDGRWLAVGRQHGSTRVFDVQTGGLAVELPEAATAYAVFTPDGRWLVTGTGTEYRFWEVATWKSSRVHPRGGAAAVGGRITFARKSPLMATLADFGTLRLINWKTGEVIADLRPPKLQPLQAIAFSPNDRILAAIGNDTLQLWDLAELRRELAALHLDWEQSSLPAGGAALGDVVFRFSP